MTAYSLGLALESRSQCLERMGQPDVIRIHEGHERRRSPGCAITGVPGCRCSSIRLGKHPNPSISRRVSEGYFVGAIVAAIVNDYTFPALFGLSCEAIERLADVCLSVVSRNDYRDQRRLVIGGARKHVARGYRRRARGDGAKLRITVSAVRIYVTSVGSEEYHREAVGVFTRLAELDTVGRHELGPTPEGADAVLFVDLHQHVRDPWLSGLRRHEYLRNWPGKVFVYDERDVPVFTLPGIYVGARHTMARRPVLGGPYCVAFEPPMSHVAPDLLFSFAGGRTHPLRDRVLALRHERAVVSRVEAASPSTPPDAGYQHLMFRSKFVLCPRGHGRASYRIYETLRAGRVPVIISDEWLPPPGVTWETCSVRVPEARVADIPTILERRERDWPQLAACARAVARDHFHVSRLWHHYGESLVKLADCRARTALPWWCDRDSVRLFQRNVRSGLRDRATARRGRAVGGRRDVR